MRKETFLRLATEEETEALNYSTFKQTAIRIAMETCKSADAIKGIIEEHIQCEKENERIWTEISKSMGRTPRAESLSFRRITNEIMLIETIPDEYEAANE